MERRTATTMMMMIPSYCKRRRNRLRCAALFTRFFMIQCLSQIARLLLTINREERRREKREERGEKSRAPFWLVKAEKISSLVERKEEFASQSEEYYSSRHDTFYQLLKTFLFSIHIPQRHRRVHHGRDRASIVVSVLRAVDLWWLHRIKHR